MEDAATQPSMLVPGTWFAQRYQVQTLLGSGGMGAVYQVLDRTLAEVVALKIMTLPAEGAQNYAEMFRQEVKLSRRVTHENVVHVYDIGQQDDVLYMTMELIRGVTLKTAMRATPEGRLPLVPALRVARSLVAGLAAVHAHGIVHRDLKPGNVMICDNGRVVLADFGIASPLDMEGSVSARRAIGTLRYMAPEQLVLCPPNCQTDVYSLGLVLLESLTGTLPPPPDPKVPQARAPFEVGLTAAGVTGDPQLIAGVEALLRRCLAIQPAERYRSAEEVGRALDALLGEEPSRAGVAMRTSPQDPPALPASEPGSGASDGTTRPGVDLLLLRGIPAGVVEQYMAARHDSRHFDARYQICAFEHFEECVRQAPGFLEAVASRAVAAVRCWNLDRTRSTGVDWEQVATRYVEESLARAPDLSDTHLAAGMLATQRWEMRRAARALARALQIDPGSHEAQEYLGGIQCETGLVDEGLTRLAFAATAIPARPLPCLVGARCHALFGRFDEAEVLIAEAKRRAGLPSLTVLLLRCRVQAYRRDSRPLQLSMAERREVQNQGWNVVERYLTVLAGTADPQAIADWVDRALITFANPRALMVLRQVSVELLSIAGLRDRALALLFDAARLGLIDRLWIERCPLLDPVRGSADFQEIHAWVSRNAAGVWG